MLLWPSSPAERASNNLRQLLSRIARIQDAAGAEFVVITAGDVRLVQDHLKVDLVDWVAAGVDGLLQRGQFGRVAEILPRYAGLLLSDVPIDDSSLADWLHAEREAIRLHWVAAASRLLDDWTGAVCHDTMLRLAALTLSVDPTCEAAYRARMNVQAAAGNMPAVRQVYRTCVKTLRAELDVAPSEATGALAISLFGLLGPAARQVAVAGDPVARSPDTPGAPRPRIAIMMLQDLEPASIKPFGAALLEDITTGLARYRSFRTIAAHTSLHPERAAAGATGTGWCDYAVHTGIRAGACGLSATFRLSRVADDEVIWADEFRVERHGAAALFRGITGRVVAAAADAVDRSELELPHPSDDPGAYRMYLEGRRQLRSTDLRHLRRARRWFRLSANSDPSYPGGFAGLARSLTMEWLVRGAPDDDLLGAAAGYAREAVDADRRDARGYRELGFATLYAKAFDESLEQFEKAVALNPHDADLLADQADALGHSGDPLAGLALVEEALLLNPAPPAYYHWVRASILYQVERYQEAIEALAPLGGNPSTARLLAACSAQVGDLVAARRYAALVRESLPGFRTESLWRIVPNRNPADTRRLIDSLLLAGLD